MDVTLDKFIECPENLHISEREANMEEQQGGNEPSIELYPDSTSSSSDEDDGQDNGEDGDDDKQDLSLGAIALISAP